MRMSTLRYMLFISGDFSFSLVFGYGKVCHILRDPGAVSWVDKMFVVILQ